jgi:hypothetical protein
MSRENCRCCYACKNINKIYCDKCDDYCCEENIKSHQEIFYLGDQFEKKVKYAENELCTKSNQVRKNIDEICNINISRNNYSLNDCENFFNLMINVYNELGNKKNEFNKKINQNKTKLENEKIDLRNDYKQKLKNISDIFDKEKMSIQNEIMNDNTKKEEKIKNFDNSKKSLEEEKVNILKKNVDKIVVDYINGEKYKIENNYQNEKKLIDEKNQLVKQNFEYTEEEKALESDYLSTINNIKNYSKKIPFFDNWIKVYNLNKYLN